MVTTERETLFNKELSKMCDRKKNMTSFSKQGFCFEMAPSFRSGFVAQRVLPEKFGGVVQPTS